MREKIIHKKSSSMQKKQSLKGILFVSPFLAGFFVFYFIPFVWSVLYSFTDGIGGIRFVGLSHYQSLFQSQAFRIAARNTLKFAVIGVPLVIVSGLGIAMVLYGEFYGKSFLRMSFLYPLTVPIAALTAVMRFVFGEDGLCNQVLVLAGMQSRDWLASETAFWILILVFIWKNCGYQMLLFLVGLYGIPRELVQAAQIEGAYWWQVFLYIRLQLLKPTFFFAGVVAIMNSFKIFREAYLIGGESPDQSIYLLLHFMNNNFRNLNYQRLSAAAFLVFLLICLTVRILLYWKNKGGNVEF